MRAAATLAATVLLAFAGASCDTAEDVRSGVDEARSSAASLGAGAREACRASDDELVKLDELSGALADDPSQRARLAPQVRQTVDRLAAAVGSRAELQPVVAASRELASAVGQASRDTVEVTARQTQVAVRAAQALCGLAR
jgi:hypothetical protein